MAITALSFDADQTLWDFREVQQRALQSTIALMVADGIVEQGSVTPIDLQRVRDEVVIEFRGRPHRLEEVRAASFVRFLERNGHPAPEQTGARLAEHFLAERFSSIRLYPDVAPALARLKPNHRIGSMAHVGDDWDDVAGANRAGCVSILIDREGRQPDFAADADHVVADLDQLESLLPALG